VRQLISAVFFGVLFISGIMVLDHNSVLSLWLFIVSSIPLAHATLAGVIARQGPLP
jgi:hypothetical protein